MADWLSRLETLSPKEINLGLERVEQVLDRLALTVPRDLLLIAGTNGKGSSVAMADALLRASGKTVGAYTSPHISRYNERIVVNGEAASDARIVSAFEAVDAARGDVVLTYFEFGTLAAALIFAEAGLDVWILEIGLGGRLDACNAFNPSASLITNVTLDHCEWLGHDVETIAMEKAGVMRRNRPTIYGSVLMPQSVETMARQWGAILWRAGKDYRVESTGDGRWSYVSERRTLESLLPPGLRGEFQLDNAAAVLALLESAGLAAGIDAALVNEVLPGLTLAGRMQSRLACGRRWLLDVAHNP
ncbi:MAG TPA: Mur ligase family protein, partial [Woeseiaceae bacterium]|nr:Mur ligase family protein [Woeseiaceae bacterium]